jgi:hypothetical protein
VYIWDEGEKNDSTFGHAAIESEDGSEYLSSYPDGYATKGQDYDGHNYHEADHVFHVSEVDETKLKKHIRDTKDTWQLWNVFNNCVDDVADALADSGLPEMQNYMEEKWNVYLPEDRVETLDKFGYEEERRGN